MGQVLGLRERSGARLPLVLMNSFATREDSLEALRRHPGIEADVPLDFVQNKVPKIARRRPAAGRVAGRPGPGVGAARPRRPLHRARHLGDARHAARARLPLRLRLELRQPRRRARRRGSSRGSRARSCRSRWRSPSARRPIARAATSRGARRTASCCARRRRRRTRTSRRCRTSGATATSTRTTSGSTSRRCATRSTRATASSACR